MTHGDMEENVSGCFFSEHSVHTYMKFVTRCIVEDGSNREKLIDLH